jgi:NAD(P)-dependent dehydrogenase (short-subunit alcohol dehydrogenase family)
MSKTAFILGGGPRVGKSLANALLEHGYKVAIGRRNPDSTGLSSGIKTVKLDLSDMSSITNAFSEVKSALGVPNVVIYNAAALHAVGDRADPFSTDTEFLVKDTEVNIFGVYTALQEAVKGFKSVGEGLPKTFIATGNILPFAPVSFLYSLGVGKAGAAHLIQSALKTEAYATAGFR